MSATEHLPTWRCFVALPVPGRVATALAWRLAPVRAAHPDVRWLTRDQLHLTLAFIGALPADRLGPLAAALDDVARATEPFRMTLGRPGRFGGRGRQEVAWIGLDEGRAACIELAQRVVTACRTSGALPPPGDELRDGAPRPHLTVARRAALGLPAAIETVLGHHRIGWTGDSIVLYRSHLGSPAVRYEVLLRLPLGHDMPRDRDLPRSDDAG